MTGLLYPKIINFYGIIVIVRPNSNQFRGTNFCDSADIKKFHGNNFSDWASIYS